MTCRESACGESAAIKPADTIHSVFHNLSHKAWEKSSICNSLILLGNEFVSSFLHSRVVNNKKIGIPARLNRIKYPRQC